uniref:Putative secreted protein n=2 Tax=Nyssorhynchus TaxID=44543 RepID=A0A2M4B1C4_9DIPT
MASLRRSAWSSSGASTWCCSSIRSISPSSARPKSSPTPIASMSSAPRAARWSPARPIATSRIWPGSTRRASRVDWAS